MTSILLKLLILSLVTLSYVNSQGPAIQVLNSSWQFTQQGNITNYPATVPGAVHLDLLENKLIVDPYYGNNVVQVQWVENITWVYTLTFDVASSSYLNSDTVELVFEGLDTHANVTLNNQTVLSADNMFRTWIVSVTSLLKQTANVLTVVFQPTPKYDEEIVNSYLPISLPSDTDIGRIFSRKAAYHFGWDWGPRLVTCGIWRPVYLQAWNQSRIDNVYYNQTLLNTTLASLNLTVDLVAAQATTYQIVVLNQDTSAVYYNNTQAFTPSQGAGSLYIPFTISNPTFWWVRNFGNQYLYNITVQISINGTLIDQRTTKVGLRTIELVQEPDDIGTSFYFKINGIPVFAKGGNYIPPDVFMPRVNDSIYEAILGDAVAANYNFIRLWGGGNFEADIFYDICDREGILLWHDFMFANGMYPANTQFLANVEQELIDNVKRLRNHPSIAIWCGNNEIKNGWEDWNYQGNKTDLLRNIIKSWYDAVFLNLIPNVLQQVDTSRPYWPSSPLHGFGHPESYVEGDNHYYSVWVNNAPIENYTLHVGRFMSEYGMQGLLCMNSIKKFLDPQDIDLNSTAFLNHERGASAYNHIDYYMDNYYKPTNSLENYLYGTQIMQKYAIQTAVEAHRLSKPRNMGTLVWQLNDDWPSFSWAGRDYYGTWKAVHYMLKERYQNILVAVTPSVNKQKTVDYNISVLSEKLFDFNATLNVAVLDFNGTYLLNASLPIVITNNSNQVYTTIPASKLTGHNLNRTLIWANISYGFDEKYSETIFYFVRPLYLELAKPNIQTQVNLVTGVVSVTSDTFVVGAYYFIDSVDLHFDSNYFDLLPGVKKSIRVLNVNASNIPDLEKDLQVIHLYNTFNSTTEDGIEVKTLQAIDDEFLSQSF